jgi:hypothetical protein
MDEHKLIEKLLRIEALHAGATTRGERVAAARAMHRILEHLRDIQEEDPPIEYRFSMPDPWARKLFLALLRRYGLKPYRYHRQRYSTVMVRVPERFVDETLWPEFQELQGTLSEYLAEVTERVISQAIHADSSEATERKQIGPPSH